MTRTQAANITQALVNLGYAPRITPGPDVTTGWRVQVVSEPGVAASVVTQFATTNNVTAMVQLVEYT